MGSVAKEDREKALTALASWCIFQLEGREPNEDTLEDLGFGSTEAIRKQLENWDIPGWVTQGNYAPERPKPSETTRPQRKTRSLGPVKDLPPAGNAAPLFRERFEALIRETERLKYRKEKLQGNLFFASSVRDAPVYFPDEALSEYLRELGLDEVTEDSMHFGGALFHLEGGTPAPPPWLP